MNTRLVDNVMRQIKSLQEYEDATVWSERALRRLAHDIFVRKWLDRAALIGRKAAAHQMFERGIPIEVALSVLLT